MKKLTLIPIILLMNAAFGWGAMSINVSVSTGTNGLEIKTPSTYDSEETAGDILIQSGGNLSDNCGGTGGSGNIILNVGDVPAPCPPVDAAPGNLIFQSKKSMVGGYLTSGNEWLFGGLDGHSNILLSIMGDNSRFSIQGSTRTGENTVWLGNQSPAISESAPRAWIKTRICSQDGLDCWNGVVPVWPLPFGQ